MKYQDELWFKALKEFFLNRHEKTIDRTLNHYNVFAKDADAFFEEQKALYPFNVKLRQDKKAPVISKEVLAHLDLFFEEVLNSKGDLLQAYYLWLTKLIKLIKSILVEIFADPSVVRAYEEKIKACGEEIENKSIRIKLFYFDIYIAFGQLVNGLLSGAVNQRYAVTSEKPSPVNFYLECVYYAILKKFISSCHESPTYQARVKLSLEKLAFKKDPFTLVDVFEDFLLRFVSLSKEKPSHSMVVSYQEILANCHAVFISYYRQYIFSPEDLPVEILVSELTTYAGDKFNERFLEIADSREAFFNFFKEDETKSPEKILALTVATKSSTLLCELTLILGEEVTKKIDSPLCLDAMVRALTPLKNVYLQFLLLKVRVKQYLLHKLSQPSAAERVGVFREPSTGELQFLLDSLSFKEASESMLIQGFQIIYHNIKMPSALRAVILPIVSQYVKNGYARSLTACNLD